LFELGLQQRATAGRRGQEWLEVRPMKADKLANRFFQLLSARPAFPTLRGMLPNLFHAASRQLAVSREKKFLI
jgi:hypothetical protein